MAGKDLMALVEQGSLKPGRGDFHVGDTVDVHVKIVEGEKERIQIFTGTVIGRKGRGATEAFTVRRLVGSEGVERVFPLHAPAVDKIEVRKHGKVRRAKLYYLRDRIGKATRVAEKRGLIPGAGEELPPLVEAVKPRQASASAPAAAPKVEAKAEAEAKKE